MSENDSALVKSLNGIKWMSTASMSTVIVNFMLTIILARLLSASDYGTFQAIAILVGFADMLWSLGIGPVLIRKKDLREEDINTGHTINIFLGLCIFLAINIAASFWCGLFAIENKLMLHIYSFIFIINTVIAVPKSILYRKCNYKIIAISSIIGVMVHAVLGIFLAYCGMGTWALIISSLMQYLVQIVWIIPCSGVKFSPMICRSSLKELLYFGGGYTLTQIFNYIAIQGDNYIINRLLGSETLGYYGKAYNLMGYPANLVGQTLDQVMYPILSKDQDDTVRLKRIFLAETCLIGIVVAPITVISVICRKELVFFLLGEKWRPVILPMEIMILALFFRTAYKLNYTVLKALGKVYIMSMIQFIYACTVIVGSYVGHFYGMGGVACGASLAIFVNYFLSLVFLMFQLKIKVKDVIFSYMAPIIYFFSLMGIAYYFYNKSVALFFSNDCVILVCMTLIVMGINLLEYKISYKWLVPIQTNEYLKKTYELIRLKIKNLLRRQSI